MFARTNFNKFVLGPYRLTVRTSPSQGGNLGSIPSKVTKAVFKKVDKSRNIPYNVVNGVLKKF